MPYITIICESEIEFTPLCYQNGWDTNPHPILNFSIFINDNILIFLSKNSYFKCVIIESEVDFIATQLKIYPGRKKSPWTALSNLYSKIIYTLITYEDKLAKIGFKDRRNRNIPCPLSDPILEFIIDKIGNDIHETDLNFLKSKTSKYNYEAL